METQELIESLKNVNINSETAEAIAKEWFRLQYIKTMLGEVGGWTIFLSIAWGIRAVWKRFERTLP